MVSSPKGCQRHVRRDSSQSPSSSLPCISRCSWLRRARRRCSAAHPPVETASSLVPKVSPLPWRWRLPHCRATAIADVPWREPTAAAAAFVPGLPDFHHTESEGQALSVSLVKPGAYLSASYPLQSRTMIRGRGRGLCRRKSVNLSHVRRLRWLRRHSHLYQARFVAPTSCSRL